MKPMSSGRPSSVDNAYTPAAGFHWLTPFYDFGIAVLTREKRWRNALVEQIRPVRGDVVADIGCGTGSLLLHLGRAEPGAKLIGIDPDAAMLSRAQAKAGAAGISVKLYQGFAHDAATLLKHYRVGKIASSLAFHHMPMREKASGLQAMYAALDPGGELHVADFGLQRSRLMRALFRAGVQVLDGRATTEPNAHGVLPELMAAAGFTDVEETTVIPTPTGSISLYRALRPT
ncbi:MAG: class I SAM-dependent methyltransferase [Rhodospirillaceae bacterium]|nr:class I SAM-dependent methyltransferase [Rhodospirillaceae bacterium]